MHGPQPSLFLGYVDPRQVTEVRTQRSTSYLVVEFLKFCPITESKELHGARKGEVKRVKEEHNVSSFVVRQTYIFELTIWHNGSSFELGAGCPIFTFPEDILLSAVLREKPHSPVRRKTPINLILADAFLMDRLRLGL